MAGGGPKAGGGPAPGVTACPGSDIACMLVGMGCGAQSLEENRETVSHPVCEEEAMLTDIMRKQRARWKTCLAQGPGAELPLGFACPLALPRYLPDEATRT